MSKPADSYTEKPRVHGFVRQQQLECVKYLAVFYLPAKARFVGK